MQTAFRSHHASLVAFLTPSSCLASSGTSVLLPPLFLTDIHLGSCDAIVSYSSSSLPRLPSSVFPQICPVCACSLSSLLYFLEMALTEESSSSVQLGPLLKAPDPRIQLDLITAASLPVIPLGVPFEVSGSVIHPVTQA